MQSSHHIDTSSFNDILSREYDNELENLRKEVSRLTFLDENIKLPKSFSGAFKRENESVGMIDNSVPGDEVLRELREILSCFNYHKFQEIFVELFIQSSLLIIYKDDFYPNEYRIRAENNIEYLYMYSLLCCPRRFGKTFTASSFAAAAAVAIPHLKITVFSPVKRQSVMLMKQVKVHLASIYKWGYTFTEVRGENNQEVFAIRRNGSDRKITGLPGKEEVSYLCFI
jgi:hypothetical protein